jgi:hypothetical protein
LGGAFSSVYHLHVFVVSLTAAPTETMAEHRARTLFNLLPIALATGYSEVEPEIELLQVLWLFIQVAEMVSHHVLRIWTRAPS